MPPSSSLPRYTYGFSCFVNVSHAAHAPWCRLDLAVPQTRRCEPHQFDAYASSMSARVQTGHSADGPDGRRAQCACAGEYWPRGFLSRKLCLFKYRTFVKVLVCLLRSQRKTTRFGKRRLRRAKHAALVPWTDKKEPTKGIT